MTPMRARSRRPTTCAVSMLLRNSVVSCEDITVVAPLMTECRGPRTACAGFDGNTWPVTSQSNNMRMQARCCLTEGGDMSGGEVFDISGHMDRLHVLQPGNPLPFAPAQKHGSGASIGRPRVAVTDIDREEFEEAAGAALPCPG